MTTVNNKTQKPVSIALPGGKTLRLGPGQSGQVTPKASESALLKKLIEAGEIELVDEAPRHALGSAGGKKGRNLHGSHISGGSSRRSGDR